MEQFEGKTKAELLELYESFCEEAKGLGMEPEPAPKNFRTVQVGIDKCTRILADIMTCKSLQVVEPVVESNETEMESEMEVQANLGDISTKLADVAVAKKRGRKPRPEGAEPLILIRWERRYAQTINMSVGLAGENPFPRWTKGYHIWSNYLKDGMTVKEFLQTANDFTVETVDIDEDGNESIIETTIDGGSGVSLQELKLWLNAAVEAGWLWFDGEIAPAKTPAKKPRDPDAPIRTRTSWAKEGDKVIRLCKTDKKVKRWNLPGMLYNLYERYAGFSVADFITLACQEIAGLEAKDVKLQLSKAVKDGLIALDDPEFEIADKPVEAEAAE